jgi:GxxExxY protein
MNTTNSERNVKEVDQETDRIAKEIVDSAFQVHTHLGPGLLENAYESCLLHELARRGLKAERQLEVPLEYKGVHLDAGFRLDVLVEKKVIVEIKSVESLMPIHRAQVLTYLKLAGLHLGFLINFNVPIIKKGIERIVLSVSENP